MHAATQRFEAESSEEMEEDSEEENSLIYHRYSEDQIIYQKYDNRKFRTYARRAFHTGCFLHQNAFEEQEKPEAANISSFIQKHYYINRRMPQQGLRNELIFDSNF